MTTCYKLTTRGYKTRPGYRNELTWGEGVTHTAVGSWTDLCSDGWIHVYEDPYVAALLNPIHAGYASPVLWECSGEIGVRDGQLKAGCKTVTTLRQIPLPEFTTQQKVYFAILCALAVFKDTVFQRWAEQWISGEDRSAAAATAAAAATVGAFDAARAYAATAAAAAAVGAACAYAAAAHAYAAVTAARAAPRTVDIAALAHQAYEWRG